MEESVKGEAAVESEASVVTDPEGSKLCTFSGSTLKEGDKAGESEGGGGGIGIPIIAGGYPVEAYGCGGHENALGCNMRGIMVGGWFGSALLPARLLGSGDERARKGTLG